MTLRVMGPNNGYVPESSGQVIAFIRKPESFRINKYVQYVPSPHPVGVYAQLGRDEAVRIANVDDARWEDGANMPTGLKNKSRATTQGFTCTRYAETWEVGSVAAKNATLWKPKLTHMREAISVSMTRRTLLAWQLFETAGSWGANTADANTLNNGKGKWDTASDDPTSIKFNAISDTFLAAAQQINLYTNSVVQIGDLRCIVSPGAARKMSQSAEMKNFMRQTEFARKLQTGDGMNMNSLWGLPSHYQGIELVVEDASYVAERAKASGVEATANRAYIKSDTSAVFCSQIGGLDGEYGSKNFSTLQMYYYGGENGEESGGGGLMRVKQEYDSWNERFKGAVIDFYAMKVAAPVSGFLVSNIT